MLYEVITEHREQDEEWHDVRDLLGGHARLVQGRLVLEDELLLGVAEVDHLAPREFRPEALDVAVPLEKAIAMPLALVRNGWGKYVDLVSYNFV